LQVFSYASGASTGTLEVLAEFGCLPAGAVVVIGDTATGQYLVAQGLLAANGSAIAAAQTNTVFTDTGDPDGRAVYIKRGFLFNGDDALEVRLNSRRCDIFGTIGQDPGTAWSGGGVSTTNQNLSRRRTARAPAAGWSQPGLVFETVGTSLATALLDFGVAPVLDDPYADWPGSRRPSTRIRTEMVCPMVWNSSLATVTAPSCACWNHHPVAGNGRPARWCATIWARCAGVSPPPIRWTGGTRSGRKRLPWRRLRVISARSGSPCPPLNDLRVRPECLSSGRDGSGPKPRLLL
jgi:hypothetical protein